MTEKVAIIHPLFDSSSIYNQMRGPGCAEGKMGGYIHWLWVRVKHEPELHPAPTERSAEELRGYARRLAGIDATRSSNGHEVPRFEVLDVWPAATFLALDVERMAEGEAAVCLVREADGAKTLGCWARLAGRGWSEGCRCRAFLLEPEVVERLVGQMGQRPWTDAFGAEAVAGVYEVAQILAAAPEMDGVVCGDEVVFERVAVPERYATLPPRKGPLRVVVVGEMSGQMRMDDA